MEEESLMLKVHSARSPGKITVEGTLRFLKIHIKVHFGDRV